jgi:hypothetical protein
LKFEGNGFGVIGGNMDVLRGRIDNFSSDFRSNDNEQNLDDTRTASEPYNHLAISMNAQLTKFVPKLFKAKKKITDVGDTAVALCCVPVPLVRRLRETSIDGGMSGTDRLVEYVINNSKANGADFVFEEKEGKPCRQAKVSFLDPDYLSEYDDGDGIIFLIQSYPERYCIDIPGGKRDFGESSRECCVREVREEIGWDVGELDEVRRAKQDMSHRWFFFRI